MGNLGVTDLQAYADPLRGFARRPESMIVPVYEAKTLFANIDQIVTAAFTFMMDLDRATPDTVAEVCLKHVSWQSTSITDISYHLELSTHIEHISVNRMNRKGCSKKSLRNSPLSSAISR
jgi:hypothetical protein